MTSTACRSVAAVVAALTGAGCTPAPSPKAAPPEPAPAARPTPARPPPAPLASASPNDIAPPSPAPAPLPAAPAGTDPEKAMFAASICAAAYSEKRVGCRSHPPFVRPEQQPDGHIIEYKGDPLLFCAINHVYRGSFTRAGATQAVLSFEQCMESENAGWDSSFPGSAVLVEEIDGRWKAVGYEPDVNADICLIDHRADGRDVLICRSGLGAPPVGEVAYFFSLDFARGAAEKSHALSFAKLFGDMELCMTAGDRRPGGLIGLDFVDMSLGDLDHDGTPDVVVKVKRASLPASRTLDAKIVAVCKNHEGEPKERLVLPKAKLFTLQFLSRGDRFEPTAATKKLLERWKAQSPNDFSGMLGVGPPLE